MIVHLVFFKLSAEVDESALEHMIRETERQLAAIHS